MLKAAMPFLVLVLLFGFTEGHLLDICFGFPLIMICSTGFSLLNSQFERTKRLQQV